MILLLGSLSGTAYADNVLVWGDRSGYQQNATTILQGLGHTVTNIVGALPTDLSVFNTVYTLKIISSFTSTEQSLLIDYVNAGGGLYMTGERPCCEIANDSVQAVINSVTDSGGIQVGDLGDQGNDQIINASVLDDFDTEPNIFSTFEFAAGGGIGGIGGISNNNVFMTSSNTGTVTAGAWACSDLQNDQGRVAIFMDVNWWTFNPTGAGNMAENIQTFLTKPCAATNNAPVINSSATASVPENQTAAINVQSNDDVDSEGSGLTYSKTGGADEALFNLDAGTGVLTLIGAPDFEIPGDGNVDNDYEVQVTVTDSGGLTDVQDIVITVTDVFENTAPTIISSTTASVPENQTAAINVQSNDDVDSEGSGLTYSKTGGADEALFNLDAGTGVLTFIGAPDFEIPGDGNVDNDYEVQVTVTDSGGLTDVQDIVITVTDVFENTAPTIISSTTASVPENQTAAINVQSNDDVDSEGSGLTYSKTGGADEALFNLDAGTGVLTLIGAPDFEIPGDGNVDNDYEVQVTVTDSGGLTDVQDIVITVTNVLDGTFTNLSATQSGSGGVSVLGTQHTETDHLVITGTGPGSLDITDGANDGAPVGSFTGVTSLAINLLHGVNKATFIGVDIPNTLNFVGGNKEDIVEIVDSMKVGGFLNIDLGKGNNSVMTLADDVLVEVMFSATIESSTGGMDVIEIANITTGNHLDVATGSFDDVVKLGTAGGTFMVGNRLTVSTGSGDNEVMLIEGVFTNAGQVYSGSGMDIYTITGSSGGYMTVLPGGGDDDVTSDSNNFSNRFRMDGGTGSGDQLTSTNDQGNPLIVLRFETVM